MDKIHNLAPELTPEAAYALAAAMSMEHLGHLFAFLDQRLGELVMFDPEARVKEATLREAIKVGGLVCEMFTRDGKEQGLDPAVLRELWPKLVDMAVLRPE